LSMEESSEEAGQAQTVRYELSLSALEARQGTKKLLPRKGKSLEVSIPAGVRSGSTVKLRNALQSTDDRPGDILIEIRVTGAQEESLPGVVEVTDQSFEEQVVKSGLPVLVDFWAPWCGPCRMIAPITEKLAQEYAGRLKFCKLNVDDNPQMAARHQVMSIPQILFFRNGTVVEQSTGAVPESALRAAVESVLRQG